MEGKFPDLQSALAKPSPLHHRKLQGKFPPASGVPILAGALAVAQATAGKNAAGEKEEDQVH